jgi:REP element-mobilizing transposase RayT
MSRFKRASHVIWHCQYHIVWVPKYRFRVLQGPVGKEVYKCVMVFSQQLGCEVGYCVDSVGLNSEMIQKYVRFQEKEEMHQEQLQLEPGRGPSQKGR